jgi:Fic-DOC domain mobile mystery protein B
MTFATAPGATPLSLEDLAGLIPALTTQGELNEFEQMNIAKGLRWAKKSRQLKSDLLAVHSLLLLHTKMFDQTWRWAGTLRTVELNIGVPIAQIHPQLSQACGNAAAQVEFATCGEREIAVRLHHKLVWIHPFRNGNGRHARLMADLFLHYRKQLPLTWGGNASLENEGAIRTEYIAALQEADRNQFARLVAFATS